MVRPLSLRGYILGSLVRFAGNKVIEKFLNMFATKESIAPASLFRAGFRLNRKLTRAKKAGRTPRLDNKKNKECIDEITRFG
jgi:hypothetical protein